MQMFVPFYSFCESDTELILPWLCMAKYKPQNYSAHLICVNWLCTVNEQPIIVIADIMFTCCYFHRSSLFIYTPHTPHTLFHTNKCIIYLYVVQNSSVEYVWW